MRKMKESGVPWIGEIPEGWEVCRIKNIANLFGRIGFRGYTQQDLVDEDEGVITLSPSNFSNMEMNYNKCSFLTWKKYEESPEIKIYNGDILFVKTGSTYGKSVRVYDLPKHATINPQLLVFKNIKINPQYFMYFLQTPTIKHQTEIAVVGGTIPTISQEKIGNFYISLSPESEQRQIAAYLDARCAEIDALTADLRRQIETLEEYKRAVITEAVTRGLDRDVETKESGVPWIGEIPAHWETRRIKYLTKIRSGKRLFNPEQDQFIGLENITSYSNRIVETETTYLPSIYDACRVGDVMFGKLRPYLAKVFLSDRDAFCTGEFLIFKEFQGSKRFLRYFMLSDGFIKTVDASTYGAKMPRANPDFILNLRITVPPQSEQRQIAAYLDARCAEIDALIADERRQIETLDEYKKSLIFEYVTGKREVPA